jgi:uncharacterized membrane protein
MASGMAWFCKKQPISRMSINQNELKYQTTTLSKEVCTYTMLVAAAALSRLVVQSFERLVQVRTNTSTNES